MRFWKAGKNFIGINLSRDALMLFFCPVAIATP